MDRISKVFWDSLPLSIIKVDCQVAISEPNTESHMLRPHNEATQCDPALRATRHRRRCRPRRGLSPLPYSSHTHPCARSLGSSPLSEIDSPGIISIVRHWRMSAALSNLFFFISRVHVLERWEASTVRFVPGLRAASSTSNLRLARRWQKELHATCSCQK